jgi:4-hydroxy-3-polyprenylbenzoate decarboxylase
MNTLASTDAYPAKPWVIAITGASGTCYGRRLVALLLEQIPGIKLDIVVSEAALRVMREEDGLATSVGRLTLGELIGRQSEQQFSRQVKIHSNRNIAASIASGSYLTEGMIIVPCSMRTLAAVANGISDNLIQRAADVVLKERRKLIIVPRETPLSAIQLENMLRLARLDVRVVPAMPGFYQQPKSIPDLIDNFVLRLADQMGLNLSCGKRWSETEQEGKKEKDSKRGQRC